MQMPPINTAFSHAALALKNVAVLDMASGDEIAVVRVAAHFHLTEALKALNTAKVGS